MATETTDGQITADARRAEIVEALRSLSAQDRRERIYLKPEFRDAYNELTEAHRIFVLPQYYFRHWRHVLGPVAHTLYEELRRRTYYNPQTGERRDSFYATQQELGTTIGLKDPKTIRKALSILEEHGFISRKTRHYINPTTNRPYRGADEITVYFEVPLTDEDTVQLLLRTTSGTQAVVFGKKSLIRHRDPRSPVDNQPVLGKSSLFRARENFPSNVSTSSSTFHNVKRINQLVDATARLSEPERARKEALAVEIGDLLHRLDGKRDLDPHRSSAFHRRVAFLLPEHLIREALSAVSDAAQEVRSGRRSLHKDHGAYFVGVLRNLAQRDRVDLAPLWPNKE